MKDQVRIKNRLKSLFFTLLPETHALGDFQSGWRKLRRGTLRDLPRNFRVANNASEPDGL